MIVFFIFIKNNLNFKRRFKMSNKIQDILNWYNQYNDTDLFFKT